MRMLKRRKMFVFVIRIGFQMEIAKQLAILKVSKTKPYNNVYVDKKMPILPTVAIKRVMKIL